MALLALYKENPTVKLITNLSAIATAIGGLVVGSLAFDARYAHSADMDTKINAVKQEQSIMADKVAKGRLEDRAQALSDKLFELRQQPTTKQQQALIKYYEDQQNTINAKLGAKPNTTPQ